MTDAYKYHKIGEGSYEATTPDGTVIVVRQSYRRTQGGFGWECPSVHTRPGVSVFGVTRNGAVTYAHRILKRA